MRYAMVIDQQKCIGCGACILGCKAENNTPDDINWCDKITSTSGRFPDVHYEYVSTMCNHCENAPCVSACPTGAMYKGVGGLTLHEPKKCIGCKACIINCPYGVISFNWDTPHDPWQSDESLVDGGTFSPKEMLLRAGGDGSPHANPERGNTYPVQRARGTVEKCNFCDHRLVKGQQPACVEACPARARVAGDLDDPASEVAQLLSKHVPRTLRSELGTRPRVFYIRAYKPERQA